MGTKAILGAYNDIVCCFVLHCLDAAEVSSNHLDHPQHTRAPRILLARMNFRIAGSSKYRFQNQLLAPAGRTPLSMCVCVRVFLGLGLGMEQGDKCDYVFPQVNCFFRPLRAVVMNVFLQARTAHVAESSLRSEPGPTTQPWPRRRRPIYSLPSDLKTFAGWQTHWTAPCGQFLRMVSCGRRRTPSTADDAIRLCTATLLLHRRFLAPLRQHC